MKKKQTLSLVLSGALSAVLLGVMDLFLLPAIERAAGGLRCFDLQLSGYDFETARAFVQALSAQGRQLYLFAFLPVDFVFIAAYTVFFVLVLKRLSAPRAMVVVWPAVLAASDFCENCCTAVLLCGFDRLSPATVAVFGKVTGFKSLMMYAVFVALVISAVRFLLNRRKQKRAA